MNQAVETPVKISQRVLLFAIIASSVPVFIDYAYRMWSRGHYQFFILVIAFAGWIVWDRRDELNRKAETPESKVLLGLLVLSWLLLSMALLAGTSFVGAVGLLITSVTLAYWVWGAEGTKALLPVAAMLLVVIPLPFQLDTWLILKMQFLASSLASLLLDAAGEIHFREGVVLIGEKRTFLTEQACSGVRSLFSSYAAVAMYTVSSRHSAARAAVNLLQTTVWVIIGNSLRVAVVVYGVTHISEGFGRGSTHEMIGLASFAFIVAMAYSTDRIIQFVLNESESARKPIAKQEAASAGPQAKSFFAAINASAVPATAAIVLTTMFVVTGLVGARRTWVWLSSPASLIVSKDSIDPPERSDLPDAVAGWEVTDYQIVDRGDGSLLAERSYVWEAKRGNLSALISIDGPYTSYHNLDECYSGYGWNTELTQRYDGLNLSSSNSEDESSETLGYSVLDLSRISGETGLVLFCTVDRFANEVTPQLQAGNLSAKAVWEQLVINFAATLGISADSVSILRGVQLPASGVQLICTPETPLSTEQKRDLTELYLAARESLLRSSRFESNSSD